MRRAVLIHGCCEAEEFYGGGPSASNSHWLPWLQKELVKRHVDTQTPEMPRPHEPVYLQWKRLLDMYRVDQHTLLVGHSCGAGFLLRWLSEERVTARAAILVAPWLDPFRRRSPFLDFILDPHIQSRLDALHVLYSQDDTVEGVGESVDQLRRAFPAAAYHQFENKGHFSRDDLNSEACPEILELIIDSMIIERTPIAATDGTLL